MKNSKKRRGFTLIELLATLVVLGLLFLVGFYFVNNAIDSSKEKSYKVVINDIETSAVNYVLENNEKIDFISIDNNVNSNEYQCIKVEWLVDKDYFDKTILNSSVNKNDTVKLDDYVYIERDVNNKTINISEYVNVSEGSDYLSLCNKDIDTNDDIYFTVNPEGWSQSKNVKIYYNADKLLDGMGVYKYKFVSVGQNKDDVPYSISDGTSQIVEVKENGTVYARIEGLSKNDASLIIDKIDTVRPAISMVNYNGNDKIVKKVTIPLVVKEGESGFNKKTFTENDIKIFVGETEIDVKKNLILKNEDETVGEYNYDLEIDDISYSYTGKLKIEILDKMFEDNANNLNEGKTFDSGITVINTYKVNYFANGGIGSMATTTCTYSQSCTLRSNSFSKVGYIFKGWSTTEGSSAITYTNNQSILFNEFTEDINLYAVWEKNTYMLTADANGGIIPATTGWTVASGGNTATKSVIYGTTYGTLPTPTRTGYTFNGWYSAASGGTIVTSSSIVNTNGDHKIYANYNANAIELNDQTFSKTYSLSSQTMSITGASNGTGSYTYLITGGNTGSYFSISGTTLTMKEKTPVATYNLTVQVKDNNSGVTKNATIKVTVGVKSISGATVTLDPTTYVYDGSAKTPTVTVKDGSTTLTKDTDYTVTYSNNTNVGTATVTITGKGNYTGTASKTFTITKASCTCTISSVPTLKYPGTTTGNIEYNCTGDGTRKVESGSIGVITVGTYTNTSAPLIANATGTSRITVSQDAGTNYSACSTYKDVTVSANTLTVTANASDGTIPTTSGWTIASGSATATKSVTYGSTYGTLPTPTKTGYSFAGWQLVPNEYQQVEYIQSTGTQYINTGVTGTARWEFDIQFTNLTTRQLMGYGGSGSEYWGVQTDGNYGLASWKYMNIQAGNRDVVIHNYGENGLYYLEVNGTSTTLGVTDVSTKQYTLFGLGSNYPCNAKLYRARTIQNGNLIRDLIPVYRKSDGVVGLYDTVNGVFYTNSGSGTFTKGSDVFIKSSSTVNALSNHTLYAKWTINNYNVYFVGNGGTISGGKTLTNMVTNGSFENGTTGWTLSNASVVSTQKYTGNYALQLNSGTTAMSNQTMNVTAPIINHKYYGRTMFLSSSSFSTADNRFEWFYGDGTGKHLVFANKSDATASWKLKSSVQTQTVSDYLSNSWYIRNFIVNGTANSYVDDVMIIDLTNTYGSGSELTNTTVLDQIPFFENTESIYSKTSLTYGTQIGTLPTPTRTGYTFNGWYTAPSGGTQITASTTVPGSDKVYYAQWSLKPVTVTADANGGTIPATTGWTVASGSATATKSVAYGLTYGTLPIPTRPGYTFNGWYTAPSGGTQVTSSSTVSTTSEHTIYAQWTINTYTVKFHENPYYLSQSGGLITTLSDRNFFKAAAGGSLMGYMYNGAYTGPLLIGLTQDSVKYSTSYDSTIHTYSGTFSSGGLTYYYSSANHWMSGNITDTSGKGYPKLSNTAIGAAASELLGKTGSTKTQSFTYGTSQALTANSFTKAGYSFKGWATSPTGSVVYSNSQSVSNLATSGTVNLYAIWEDDIAPSISVSNTVNGSAYNGEWTNQSVSSKITFSDSGSGIALGSLQWKCGTSEWSTINNTSTIEFTDGWTNQRNDDQCYYRIKDNAGKYAQTDAFPIRIDTEAPTGTLSVTKNVTTITASFSDVADNLSGVKEYQYLIQTSSSCPTSGYTSSSNSSYTFIKSTAGTYYVCARILDNVGNIGIYSKPISITAATLSFSSSNLLYGLSNISSGSGEYMTYSVSNGTVTVTAKSDDGYGYTNGRVYLEANKTYTFNCTTNGTWSATSGEGGVEAFLMLNGSTSTAYYHMDSNSNYTFTPTVSGLYWLRLDVNKNGQSNTFSNIRIEQIQTSTLISGTTIGTLPTVSRTNYTFNGWFTAESGGTQITSSTIVPSSNTTYYAQWTSLLPVYTYLKSDGSPASHEFIDDGSGNWRIKFYETGILTVISWGSGVDQFDVFLVGGGGGGGGSSISTDSYGGGGGGGGYVFTSKKNLIELTSYNVTIGAGGAGGASRGTAASGNYGYSGGAGTASSISNFSGTFSCSANGGSGGASGSTQTGGSGGSGGGGGSVGWSVYVSSGGYWESYSGYAGQGGSKGGNGSNAKHAYTGGDQGGNGGTGAGKSTAEFGDDENTFYAGGGAGGYAIGIRESGVAGKKANASDGGGGASGKHATFYGGGGGGGNYDYGHSSPDGGTARGGDGYQGIVIIRNNRD